MKKIMIYLLLSYLSTAQIIPFDTLHWQLNGKDLAHVNYLGKDCVYARAATLQLKNVKFKNGTVNFNMAFGKERGFTGFFFRYDGDSSYEHFYFRPHLSGFADANTYVPVYNNISSWQLYFGPDYSSPQRYYADEWFHVRLVIRDQEMLVYIDDMNHASLYVGELRQLARSGEIGFTISGFAPAYVADFSYSTRVDDKLFAHYKASVTPRSDSIIYNWFVSSTVSEQKINELNKLDASFLKSLNWSSLVAENSGITNLAKVQGITADKNTTLVKVTIQSEKDQVKRLRFGYS
ncbi:MAG: hypothetical protein KDD94_03850, partial [Calditrichaeota bacterium]|nr:hypothetical protein [Calditrichota bacterium]